MQQDGQFHDAGSPGVPYAYTMHGGQLPHVVPSPSNYYGMEHLAGMEDPLPTRYPDSSHRSVVDPDQYNVAYGAPATFQGETYHLSTAPDGPFCSGFAGPGPPHGHLATRDMRPFSNMHQHSSADSLANAEGNFYKPPEMTHRYAQGISPTHHALQQHNTPSDYEHFAYSRAPNDTYIPTSRPSLSGAASRFAGNSTAQQLKRRPFAEDPVPDFKPPHGISFEQRHFHNSSNEADSPDRPDKSADLRRQFPDSHHPVMSSEKSTTSQPDDSVSPPTAIAKKKKSKMHDCEICGKKFPRPSGLRTHMNTHNNVKPYPCSFPGCTRSFAVRSNAKRHLRTHGVVPSTAATSSPLASSSMPYLVGFATPTVAQAPEGAESHQVRRAPFELKWMPPSLSTRTNAGRLRSISDEEESEADEDEDDYEELPRTAASVRDEETIGFQAERGEGSSTSLEGELNRSVRSALSIPLRAVVPTSPPPPSSHCSSWNLSAHFECYARYEERNSFSGAGSYPYHPSQFHALPGPAILCPSLTV